MLILRKVLSWYWSWRFKRAVHLIAHYMWPEAKGVNVTSDKLGDRSVNVTIKPIRK